MVDRPGRGLGVLFVVLLVLSAVAPGTVAAETRVGPTVTVAEGEVQGEDLTTAAGTVRVLGTVDGDVTALAGDVIVAGEVTGDVTAFAGRVEVAGTVGGDVTAFGGVTQVGGDVDGGLNTVVGGLDVSGRVGDDTDAVGIFVDVREGARLQGRLRTAAIRTEVNGTVAGVGGRGPANAVAGRVGDRPTDTDPQGTRGTDELLVPVVGAIATGEFVDASNAAVLQLLPGRGGVFELTVFETYRFLVNLLLGVVLLWLLPRFSAEVASLVGERPVHVGAYGFGVLLFAPVVLVLVALSLFGLPLALAGGVLLVVVMWVASVYGRFAIGTWALAATTRGLRSVDLEPPRIQNRWLALLVGYLLVGVAIRIPLVGTALDTVVLALGLGALTHLGYAAYRRSERELPVAGSDSEFEST